MHFTKNRLRSMAGWLNFFCAILLMAIAICALTPPAFGADDVGTTTELTNVVDRAPAEGPDVHATATPGGGIEASVIAIVTPLLVAGIRWLVPMIPKVWLPIVSAGLGLVIDLLLPALGMKTTGFGFALGLAGVGVREAQKQIRTLESWKPNLALLVFAGALLLFGSGCARYLTIQEDSSYEKGQLSRKITTRVSAGTFVSAQSELARSTVTQTDKTQSSKVGSIAQAATNSVGGIRDVVDLINAIKTPFPVPAAGN